MIKRLFLLVTRTLRIMDSDYPFVILKFFLTPISCLVANTKKGTVKDLVFLIIRLRELANM